jgi:hypothetical protein
LFRRLLAVLGVLLVVIAILSIPLMGYIMGLVI